MKRRAVSIVELSIGIALLVLLASQITLSTNLSTQTPKREAERLAKKLSNLMLKAEKMHITSFNLTRTSENMLLVTWNSSHTSLFLPEDIERYTEKIHASPGCTYAWWKSASQVTYHPNETTFNPGGTIVIRGNGDDYYVIMNSNGGRVRISDIPPP